MFMKKPKAKARTIMDWFAMEEFIQDKYKCDLDDYAAHKHGVKSIYPYNIAHEFKWKHEHYPRLVEFEKDPLPNYGLNKEGMDFSKTREGSLWFDGMRVAYNEAPDGQCKEIPFWCFWHFVLDITNLSNGTITNLNFADMKEEALEDWQKEICDLFVAEFGDEDMEVEFSW